jgi:hypothetical protein
MGKTKKKYDSSDISHYNTLWKMTLRTLWNCYLNEDYQFGNKVKGVMLAIQTEMREKDIDVVKYQLEDFTVCNDLGELYKWIKEHTLLELREDMKDIEAELMRMGVKPVSEMDAVKEEGLNEDQLHRLIEKNL